MNTTPFCEGCERDMSLVPAGVSKKTGKPYNAFYSCDKRNGGCGKTQNAEPGSTSQAGDPNRFNSFREKPAPGNSSVELSSRLDVIEAQLGIVPPHKRPKMDDMDEIRIEDIPF